MEQNPVMQRVAMLTAMWREAVTKYKEARVFAWVGSSSIDYRMIKGFVLFHTSEQSDLDDLFFSLNQPFAHDELTKYGARLISEMNGFITAWNGDKNLTAKTGKLAWAASVQDKETADETYFVQNINALAEALGVSGEGDVLALALLPQTVTDYTVYAQWVHNVLKAGLSENVRIMLFDTYEQKAFASLEEAYPKTFKFLYPDLDMPGAMNQILEHTKSTKKSSEERDAISFQQALLKMNEAISYGSEKNSTVYKNECLQLAVKNSWLHLEALVYFFLHSFYVSQKQLEKALQAINTAVQKTDVAVEKKLVEPGIRYQYRIAKGNLLFMNKRYPEASEAYKECLQLDRTAVDKRVLLGVYQMLGNSTRKEGFKKQAWSYFNEGWQLVQADEELLKKNAVMMFYANDMIAAAYSADVNADALLKKLNGWWGHDWQYKLSKGAHEPVLD